MSILECKHVSIKYITGDLKDIGLKEFVLRKVRKDYHVSEFWADKNITFSIDEGDMLGIIGANGAGKSTLLKAISGIMEPSRGYIHRKGKIAALLELTSGFDGDLTVKENTYLRGAMLGYTREFMDETYDRIIDFAELRAFEDRPFKHLSSGMKSRLAFSIASLVNPDILILDEVLSVGDGAFKKKSEAKMREVIAGGATTILVSHALSQVRDMCNKVLWLHKGEQVAFGDTAILCDLYSRFMDNEITIDEAKACWETLQDHYDYLIVGGGLFGAVFAHEMTEQGKKCLVIDRRKQIGGNVACENIGGITVHKYGAHIFHTDSKDIWDYVNKYSEFTPYTHKVSTCFAGKKYSMPFNMYTFRELWGVNTEEEARKILAVQRTELGGKAPQNLEEQALALVGRDIYEKLIKGYSEKQWGRICTMLPPSIIDRIPLRFEFDDRYFSDEFQGMPKGGYNALIENLLKDCRVCTGLSYNVLVNAFPHIADRTIYTGAIDEFFGYELGELEYRSLKFETELLHKSDYQGQAVVNFADGEIPYTRIIEHKHFEDKSVAEDTVITREYPANWVRGKEAYYPIRDEKNLELYNKYAKLAEAEPNVIFCGRLGSYQYFDMDDTVGNALSLAKGIDDVWASKAKCGHEGGASAE